ncbi:MAG: glycosyltransferase [Prevotella sp.]|nr:glycosyltransferase [Prevotella sp.]
MIRIAIIAGVLHSGGKRNLIMEFYRHIDRTKVQYDFICDSDSNGIPTEEIESLGGKVYVVPPYKQIVSHMRETYKILKENKYSVMHAFDNTLNLFPMFLGRLAGVKVRISESISKGDKSEKKTLVKLALRPFSHWFATDYMANSIDCGKWQFGGKTYKKGKINIFKTVINAEENAFDQELRNATRLKFGWDDKMVYGFIGRYVDQKNPLFLIDIFNEITKRQENAILVMIGFGELEGQMMARVQDYGLQDRVENLGRRDDIKQFYNAFDAFLLPSLYEGMPVVGVEAQCCGLPIFFSKNITEETTACDLAHYIGLDESASQWAETIVPIVKKEKEVRRSRVDEVKLTGFDSESEAHRLQEFYYHLLNNESHSMMR